MTYMTCGLYVCPSRYKEAFLDITRVRYPIDIMLEWATTIQFKIIIHLSHV